MCGDFRNRADVEDVVEGLKDALSLALVKDFCNSLLNTMSSQDGPQNTNEKCIVFHSFSRTIIF